MGSPALRLAAPLRLTAQLLGPRCVPAPHPDFFAAVGLATMALGYAQGTGWCDGPLHDRFMLGAIDASLAWSVWRGAALNARVLGVGKRSGGRGTSRGGGAGPDAHAGAALAAMAWGASGAWLASAVDAQVRRRARCRQLATDPARALARPSKPTRGQAALASNSPSRPTISPIIPASPPPPPRPQVQSLHIQLLRKDATILRLRKDIEDARRGGAGAGDEPGPRRS
jgi:hypothetical protein